MLENEISGIPKKILVDITDVRSTLSRTIKLIWELTPRMTLLSFICAIILGILPFINLYLIKLIVDTATRGITATEKGIINEPLILLIIITAVFFLFSAIWREVSNYLSEEQSSLLTDKVNEIIHKKSISLDLAYYEKKENQETLHIAQYESYFRFNRVLMSLITICQGIFSIVSVSFAIFVFSPIAGLIIFCSAIPLFLSRLWSAMKLYSLRIKQTEIEKKSRYYHNLLTNPHNAKEIKIFDIGNIFSDRYNVIRNTLRDNQRKISREQVFWNSISQIFITLAIFGTFIYIVFMAIDEKITTGSMVIYFMGFQMFIGFVNSIFSGLSIIYENQLFLKNLFLFLDQKPEKKSLETLNIEISSEKINNISLEHVFFKYPDGAKYVLSDINLTINKGEVIAFVGENGAGKSSLVKIICSLYEIESGNIYVNGKKISTIDPEEWRRHITVLFQDYVCYQTTAEENIRLGKYERKDPVELSANQADADLFIKELPKGYQTILGKYFQEGQSLSIGQWQRISLARAFFRDADIIILDEPSSSLDAIAEIEIFKVFRELMENRITILISHRFSTIMMADKIYVLGEGKILEHGTHDTLMKREGKYAEMFNAQASSYRN